MTVGNKPRQIADFGTARWIQLTTSPGLATYTVKGSQHTQMSLPWAAPEVGLTAYWEHLDAGIGLMIIPKEVEVLNQVDRRTGVSVPAAKVISAVSSRTRDSHLRWSIASVYPGVVY